MTMAEERWMSRTNSTGSANSSMSSWSSSRPRRITMAGMIYDANRLLAKAMDPKISGLHPGLFDDGLLGIGFYTVLEAGLLVSGNVGTGIVMARNPTNGDWSAPAAVGLSGIGWGLMGGANMKSLVYLIYDYYTLDAMSGETGVMLSSQAGASLGSWGRTAEASAIMSAKGLGKNIALAYSHGIFGGLSIEGAVSRARNRVNEKFYGRKLTTAEILFSGKQLDIPEGTLMPEVYNKLRRLCHGLPVYEPTPEEKAKVELILRTVDKESEEAIHGDSLSELVIVPDDATTTSDNGQSRQNSESQINEQDNTIEEEEAIECYLDTLRGGGTEHSIVTMSSSDRQEMEAEVEAVANQ